MAIGILAIKQAAGTTLLSPLIIGANGDQCDTIATAYEPFRATSWDQVIVAGKTYSERQFQGYSTFTTMKTCLDYPVTFI